MQLTKFLGLGGLFGVVLSTIFISTTGSAHAQTIIRTIEDLDNVRNDPAGDYVLGNDLDFALASSYAGTVVNSDYRPNAALLTTRTTAGFVPIGSAGTPFTGTFDGNGFVIRNLYVQTTAEAGLFGSIEGATLRNLGVVERLIIGLNAGGIVGIGDGTITHCYSTGTVRSQGDGSAAGGIIGSSNGVLILTYCYATGDIRGFRSGGLIGSERGSMLTIEDCYTTGRVASRKINDRFSDTAGGLIGITFISTSVVTVTRSFSSATISAEELAGGLIGIGIGTLTDCYATGDISTDFGNAAGLVGSYTGTVTNCYATGNVSSNNGSVAGLIGTLAVGSALINCYATGNVSSLIELAGGLVAFVNDGTLTDCYATGNVRTNTEHAGGLVGESRTLRLTNCYATGDINTVGANSTGGLVGLSINGMITDCYATGNVTSVSDNGETNTGGLVGKGSGTIENCYSTGGLDGTDSIISNVGGILGFGAGTITNCYRTGTSINGANVGGIVGNSNGTLTLTNCLVTGTLNSGRTPATRGGLAGTVGTGTITITDSYWDSETTGQPTTSGTGGTAQTTMQLQTLTAMGTGWDTSIWDFGTSTDYPTLRPAVATNTPTPPPGGWDTTIWDLSSVVQPALHPFTRTPQLTPLLIGGSFVEGAAGDNITYNHTISNVEAGSASRIISYTLSGTNLSTETAVVVSVLGEPNDLPFTFINGDGFTSIDGGVPSGNIGIQIRFAPPDVATTTIYTYTIVYTEGGLVDGVQVLFAVQVVPAEPAASTLTPLLIGGGNFVTGTAGDNSTYTHTINNAVAGSPISPVSYTLAGTNLSTATAVAVATTGEPTDIPFTLINGGGFTSADGGVPAGSLGVQVGFAPPTVNAPTTYTYTITYTEGGLVGGVQVRVVVNVVPAPDPAASTLTPLLIGGNFVAGTAGDNSTYTHTINNVVAGSANRTVNYSLVGTNLSTATAVAVATTGEPTDTPFTLINGGGFTSTDGGVPAGSLGVQVGFVPPTVNTPTTYTYTITYTEGGLVGGVQVRVVVNVVPAPDPAASTLTPLLIGGNFVAGTAGDNSTYTHTINNVVAGSANRTVNYSLVGTNLSTATAVAVATTGEPTDTPFTLINGGGFTSTDGSVPSSNLGVQVGFAPPVVGTPTTYTYTITYTEGGLVDGVQVRVVVNVVPQTATSLTPLLAGGSFVTGTADGNSTYTHTINNVVVGSANSTVSYTLAGTNLSTTTAVAVATTGEPANAPFTLMPNDGGFTSTDGSVPAMASPVTVTFAVPAVEEPTTYTYKITYTGGGFVGGVQVRVVVQVVPVPDLTTSTLTPSLVGSTFTLGTADSNNIYTHTINNVVAGSTNRTVSYTLAGINLSTTTAVTAVATPDPIDAPFTLMPNDGGFTSTNGDVPSGQSTVQVDFTPPVVSKPTTYTHTVVYSGGGFAGRVHVRVVVQVVPPTATSLTPSLVGVSFIIDTSDGSPTYIHTMNNVASGSTNRTVSYTLAGINLSTTTAVTVVATSDPIDAPFTLMPNDGSFTSTDGGVPLGQSPAQVDFAPPEVSTPTTYTYTITYTGGGVTGEVRVRVVAHVVPPTPLGVEAALLLADQSSGVVVSPNPTSEVLFIRGEASRITLLDVSGRVRRTAVDVSGQHNIIRLDVSGLSAGLYVARITTPSGIIARRIVVR